MTLSPAISSLSLKSLQRVFVGPLSWWQVVIQLLLIGAVVFWVIRFLQGTRGARLLKGMGVVLIGSYLLIKYVGHTLGLTRIGVLYDSVLPFATIALAVVFQPELRRALMRLGE